MRGVYPLVVAVLALCASAAAGADTDKSFERTVPAGPKGAVDISNVSGSIDVSGWDRPEVAVRAELGAGVERVDVSTDHGRTTIKVVVPNHLSFHSGEAQLHVQVPKYSDLTVSAVSADLTTSGMLGLQHLNAVSGDVSAELAGADLELKAVSGNVKLKGHGQPARLHVSTVSGDLRLDHGAGELEAGTVSGTMVISLDSASSVRLRSTSGDVHFDGDLARDASLDGNSVSGDFKIRTRAAGGYAYELSSFSGDLNSCFKGKEKAEDHMPGKRLDGTLGAGAAHVRMKSMSGDIELCDRK